MGMGGKAIEVQIVGYDLDRSRVIAEQIKSQNGTGGRICGCRT